MCSTEIKSLEGVVNGMTGKKAAISVKLIKKRLGHIKGFVVMAAAIVLIYGIFSGDLESYMTRFKKAASSKENDTSSSVAKEYPPGEVIEDYVNAFDWTIYPSEKSYDPNNKSMKYNAYGISKDEEKYLKTLQNEVVKYDKEHPISDECKGSNKINPSCRFNIGQEVDIRQDSMKVTINSIDILEDVSALDEDYFLPEVRESNLVSSYDKSGNLMDGVKLFDCITNEPLDNQKLLFVKVNLTIKSYSNWVETIPDVSPSICFCEDNKQYISGIDGYFAKNGDNVEGYSFGPMYFDLGSYSYTAYKEQNLMDYSLSYPMRIGEEVTFNAVYVCPEQLIDKAYLFLGSSISWGGENANTYNDIFIKFIKVTEENT